jgi:uncharacterized protein YndB with AHSA1/START domain
MDADRRPTVEVDFPFSTSAARVYDAWLDPLFLGCWMFGPAVRDEQVLRIAIEPRVGGAFSFRVLREGRELEFYGTYHELERPWRLAFTWGADHYAAGSALVAIDISPEAVGCGLTLTHHGVSGSTEGALLTIEDWTKALRVLAFQLQALPHGRHAEPQSGRPFGYFPIPS